MQMASHKVTPSSLMISSEDPDADIRQQFSESAIDNGSDEPDEHDGAESRKQQRLLQACDSCRRKKIKCDSTKPSCWQCKNMRLACHYSPLVRKRRRRRSAVGNLEQRIECMERILQPLIERILPTSLAMDVTQGRTSPLVQNSAQIYLPADQRIPHEPCSQRPALKLPSPDIIEEMIGFVVKKVTPMAPPTIMRLQIERFRSGELPEFTICAIIALGARFSNRPEFVCSPKYNAGRAFAERSAELISGLVDRPSPNVVECLMMLSTYEWGCGRGESAWTYNGMATRLAQRCRLHLIDEEDFNENSNGSSRCWAEAEWHRRLWWYVYCGERVSVIVASRPATVHDDDIVVNLPSRDYNWIMGIIPDENELPAQIPDYWWMAIEMYRIGGRIAEFANRRRRPVRPSDLSRRATFDALDKELESIRGRFVPYLEFPPRTEWLLSGYANLGDGTNGMTNICAIYFNLHIMYYGAKIILYRSELPSYTYEKISPEMIQRAKAVCIEAAHKQADVIRWALESVPVEYWDPKIGIWSLQGASIHVNAALCDDSAIAEQSRRDLEVHLKMHVAADQFYHFNMAMITMLHHVFNLRKKQRLLTANKASGISEDGDSELLIEHENDPDPWIVPRCSSYLGFTYTYSKLHGFLNDAIKQTTYSPPDLKMVESDHYRTLEQANPQTNGPAISMVNALVGDPLQQQPQSRDMDFRRMSVDASMGPPRQFSFDSHNGASHQMWNTRNAARRFNVEAWHSQTNAPESEGFVIDPALRHDAEMSNEQPISQASNQPSNYKFSGVQRLLSQIDRLSEPTSRFTNLQQLNDISNSIRCSSPNVSGATSRRWDHSVTKAPNQQPASNTSSNVSIPTANIDMLLNNLVSGVESTVADSPQQQQRPQQQQNRHSFEWSEQLLSNLLSNHVDEVDNANEKVPPCSRTVCSPKLVRLDLSQMSSAELQNMISKLIAAPQHDATSTSEKHNAVTYGSVLQHAPHGAETSLSVQRQQAIEGTVTEMNHLIDGISLSFAVKGIQE